MAGTSTLAYVIKTQDYRDTSLLATFYTLEFGKVKAIIKGGRDGRSKMGSTFEPFSLNEIIVYKRKRGDLHLVTSGELVERYNPIRKDLNRLSYATYFMELVDQMTDEAPHPEIYQLMSDGLSLLISLNQPSRVARLFEMKLMNALGFNMQLNECVRCEQNNPELFYFSPQSGGIVCQACRNTEGPILLISSETLEFLRTANSLTFTELRMTEGDEVALNQVEKLMMHFLENHWAYRPKSLIFMDKVKLDKHVHAKGELSLLEH